jgi:hypothetical protein
MPISEAYTLNAVTVGTTELSIVSGTTTLANDTNDGVYSLMVDSGNMAKGDEFRVRVYEKCLTGSTKKVIDGWTMLGVQGRNHYTPPMILMHGWDMTIQKIAGTDRAFTASIRKVA